MAGEPSTETVDTRDLVATIDALRAELERRDAMQADAVTAAVRDARDQITELEATVNALRTELERQGHDHEEALGAARRAFRDEREQLERTVTALRAELEVRGAGGG